MNWNQALFPSLKRVDARSRKCREATLVRADGVARSASPIGRSLKKRSAKSLGLKSFAELTTPSAALRRLRVFLLMPQPPLLFKEGNVSALKQSVNSFTPSKAGAYNASNVLGYFASNSTRLPVTGWRKLRYSPCRASLRIGFDRLPYALSPTIG